MTPHELEELLFDSGEQITDLPFEDYRRINIYRGINYCQTDNECFSADPCASKVCNIETNQCETGPPINCENQAGWVNSAYKINEAAFGNGDEFGGDNFGSSIANMGDLDGDNIPDLAVGEARDDDGGESNGAVWILFLNESGGVKSEYKINESRFGNGNELGGDRFGNALANLGDLDGDGISDLAVGERRNDDGGVDNGAVWILFLNQDGSVKDSYKINESRFFRIIIG